MARGQSAGHEGMVGVMVEGWWGWGWKDSGGGGWSWWWWSTPNDSSSRPSRVIRLIASHPPPHRIIIVSSSSSSSFSSIVGTAIQLVSAIGDWIVCCPFAGLTRPIDADSKSSVGHVGADLKSSADSVVADLKSSNESKVLVYPEHELLPRIFTTWQSVVAKIDESYDLALCVEKSLERYFLPRPDLFTNVNSHPKLFEYLVSWLRIHGIVLSCMGHGQPQAISHKVWRLWLDRRDLVVTVMEGGTNAPRKMKDKEEVMALLAVAREHSSVELPDEGKWKGRIFRSDGLLAERHSREILWEVNELAFCCELAALDERLSTLSSARERYNRVRRCFPIGLAPLHFADLGQANHGLAHPDWFSRAPFVYALRHVMQFWKLDVVHAARWLTDEQYFKIDEKRGLTEANLDDVEHKLIKIYISSFLAVYGRTPRLPMILSHHPHTEWKQPVYHRMAVGPNGIWMPERESDSLYDYWLRYFSLYLCVITVPLPPSFSILHSMSTHASTMFSDPLNGFQCTQTPSSSRHSSLEVDSS
ncbi:hypothetical protein BDZ89DRAFT_1164193 [Hymenopellis radicata]|nr:hypothetical protein BDZ89DRAFT_1164193 [Hymenopellis radicata]